MTLECVGKKKVSKENVLLDISKHMSTLVTWAPLKSCPTLKLYMCRHLLLNYLNCKNEMEYEMRCFTLHLSAFS